MRENNNINIRQNMRVAFRAFLINLVLGIIVFALMMWTPLYYISVLISGISPMTLWGSFIAAIALWQMLNVIFFLVPAIAMWWERKVSD